MPADRSRLVRRLAAPPLVRLGDRERLVEPFLGERFGAYRAKERDLVLALPPRSAAPPPPTR